MLISNGASTTSRCGHLLTQVRFPSKEVGKQLQEIYSQNPLTVVRTFLSEEFECAYLTLDLKQVFIDQQDISRDLHSW